MRAELDPQLKSARFELDYRRAVVRHLDELDLFWVWHVDHKSQVFFKSCLCYAFRSRREHSTHPSKKGMKDHFSFESEASAATVRRITSVNEMLTGTHAVLIRGESRSPQIRTLLHRLRFSQHPGPSRNHCTYGMEPSLFISACVSMCQ